MLKLRDRHTILNKWVDVKSAVPIEQMREVVQQQQKLQSQRTKSNQKKSLNGKEMYTKAIITFPNSTFGGSYPHGGDIKVPVIMQMPETFFKQNALTY